MNNEFKQGLPTQVPSSPIETQPIPETVLANLELSGNDNVEPNHELTLEPGYEIANMVEEAISLTETTTENDLETSQVELPEEVTPEIATQALIPTPILEKKSKAPLFAGAAAGLAVLLGGLGISGMFSGKKPEMGMTGQTPKVEQANTGTKNSLEAITGNSTPDRIIDNSGSGMNLGGGMNISNKPLLGIPTTKEAPTEATTSTESNDEVEIQRLMKSSSMSRARAEATYARIKVVNNSPEAKAKQQALGEEEYTPRPGYAEHLAKMDAENKANNNEKSNVGNMVRDLRGEEYAKAEKTYGLTPIGENVTMPHGMQRAVVNSQSRVKILINWKDQNVFKNQFDKEGTARNIRELGGDQKMIDDTINKTMNADYSVLRNGAKVVLKAQGRSQEIQLSDKEMGVVDIPIGELGGGTIEVHMNNGLTTRYVFVPQAGM
jgi:hypothetical protein